jgi:hypothetical protein
MVSCPDDEDVEVDVDRQVVGQTEGGLVGRRGRYGEVVAVDGGVHGHDLLDPAEPGLAGGRDALPWSPIV